MHICQSQIQDIMPSFAYSRYKALCPSSFILLKSRNDIWQLTFLTAVQFKHTCLTLINDLVSWRRLFFSQYLPFVSFKVVLKISNLFFFKRDLVMYDIYCYQRSNKTNVIYLKIRIDENFKNCKKINYLQSKLSFLFICNFVILPLYSIPIDLFRFSLYFM